MSEMSDNSESEIIDKDLNSGQRKTTTITLGDPMELPEADKSSPEPGLSNVDKSKKIKNRKKLYFRI